MKKSHRIFSHYGLKLILLIRCSRKVYPALAGTASCGLGKKFAKPQANLKIHYL